MQVTPTESSKIEKAQQERRAEQRFPLRLPVVVKCLDRPVREESSVTRDVSARGAFFYLDAMLAEGTPLQIILTLPSEITLTESIRVRCKGSVARVTQLKPGAKVGIAAVIERYDFTRNE
jgi:hypothetical protein